MTTYVFPSFTRPMPFTEWHFGMDPNDRAFPGLLSGQVTTVEFPGARWALALRLQGLNAEERATMNAFMAKMRGRANRFTAFDFMNPRPRGTMRGSPVTSGTIAAGGVSCTVNAGVGQAGTTIAIGDKFNIGGELKMAITGVTLNGSGVGSFDFEPPARASIASGSGIAWDKPTALFRLTESSWRMSYTVPRFGDVPIDAVEAFA
jgi:hypothetical protein